MRYSREVFDLLKPLYQSVDGRVGGAGVKLHPDFRYGNLYHWLIGDETIVRRGTVAKLPEAGAPFSDHPNEPLAVEELLDEEKQRKRQSGAAPA
jgi:hypothetical protein